MDIQNCKKDDVGGSDDDRPSLSDPSSPRRLVSKIYTKRESLALYIHFHGWATDTT